MGEVRWNLNIRQHRRILAAVPSHARTAIDVGSGDGLLSFDLADRGLQVVGVDIDAEVVGRSLADPRASDRVSFLVGDVLQEPLEGASFDVVASVSMLHHVDPVVGLRRLRELVAPAGVLAVVSFARPSGAGDVARAAVGASYKRWRRMRGAYWEHTAPTAWPPPMTSRELAAVVARELPGATCEPLLSGRVLIVWRRPADEVAAVGSTGGS